MSQPRKENPEALVLRGKPRPVVRFRRSLVVGLTGALAVSLIALSWVALDPPSLHKAKGPLENDGPATQSAEAVRNLPANYADVPRLGPPLPGDLGRPILEHEQSLGEPPAASSFDRERAEKVKSEIAAERQQIAAARSSALLVQTGEPAKLASQSTVEGPGAPEPEAAQGLATVEAPASERGNFGGFLRSDVNDNHLRPAAARWMLAAGTIIPASLMTGLNSDLPGMVIAQVTQNVRDSASGQAILVPQGARLIGSYDDRLAYGQRRALLIWKRLIYPDGSSVRLDNMPAADASGYSGVEDRVDSHGWQLLKGIALSTLLGVGTQLSIGSERSGLVRAIRQSAEESAANAGNQITSRNLDVQPTVTVRPGWPVRAIVNEDIVLPPWRG